MGRLPGQHVLCTLAIPPASRGASWGQRLLIQDAGHPLGRVPGGTAEGCSQVEDTWGTPSQ